MLNLSKLMSLKDRRALITGGNGHIGRIIALTLAELGADLILVDRHGSDYRKLINEIKNNFKIDVQTYDCDLGIQNDRRKLISTLCNEDTSLNILINNAAFVGDTNLELDRGAISDTSKVRHFSTTVVNFTFKEPGYMDELVNKDKVEDFTIKLGMCMAASDGSLDQKELKSLKIIQPVEPQ